MIAATILGTSLNAMADFAGDFQEAKKLFDAKDYQAAHQAFTKLAADAPNDHGKSAGLSFAAIALGRLKQTDKAIETAKTIKAKPMAAYTQMQILCDNRTYKESIAAFADEDIAAWPDRINYLGFRLRGTAYERTGQERAALKDFQQCVDLAGSDVWVRLEALNKVAALHHALKDDAKGMEAYKTVFAICDADPRRKGRWTYPQALLGAARILADQGNYDEAKAVLAGFKAKPAKERSSWDFQVLEAYGDIAAAQGNQAEALTRYQDAIAIDTHKGYTDRVAKKIAALQGKKDAEPK